MLTLPEKTQPPRSVAEIRARLKACGRKFNEEREEVARILVDAPSSINAEELWARAGGSSSRLSRATAYRVLNLFTQLGITESSTSLTGGQVFRLRRPLPSLYLVCAQQGVIEELDDPQIAQALATLARRNGCRLHGAIELRVTRLAGD